MRIRVIPNALQALAAQWRQVSVGLGDVRWRVQHAWASLDWEVRNSASLENLVILAQRQAQALEEEAARLARFLDDRAVAFEQADREGMACWAQTSEAWRSFMERSIGNLGAPHIRFPDARVRSYWRLGEIFANQPSGPGVVQVEPAEAHALIHFAADEIMDRVGLGLIKDLLDVGRVPAWQAEVHRAADAWGQTVMQFGGNSPQARAAYGLYLETLVFRMPFFGEKAEALLSILKIIGRMNPAY